MNKKIIILIYFLIEVINFSAQNDTIVNLFFKEPQPNNIEFSYFFPENLKGCYLKKVDSLVEMCISKDSIYTSFSIIINISQEDFFQKKYSIKDSLIYGIKNNAGLPFKKFNDTIYALLKQTELFFKIDERNKLKIQNNKLYLNEQILGKFYKILELSFVNQSLIIKESNHEMENYPIEMLNVSKSQIDNLEFHLAEINFDDWFDFVNQNGFNDSTEYIKKTE